MDGARLGKAHVPGNRLRSNRWVRWVERIAQGWEGEERTRTFETNRATLRENEQALKEHRNARTFGLSQAAPESTNKQAWKRPK